MFAEDLENIDYNNIIICDPIKNSIIDYSSFYKIIYSNSYVSYNGVFTIFRVNNVTKIIIIKIIMMKIILYLIN